jgi:hypothetical protein
MIPTRPNQPKEKLPLYFHQHGWQLDPNSSSTNSINGTVYTLLLTVPGASSESAPVLSVGTTDGTWRAGNEYWALSTAFTKLWNSRWPTSSPTPTLQLSAVTYTTAGPPTDWNKGVATTSDGAVATNHWARGSTPPSATLYSGSFGVTITTSGTVSTATWYFRGDSAPNSAYVVNSNGATFTTTQPTAGAAWWILST